MPTKSLQRMLALATLAVSGFVIAGCGHPAQGAVTSEAAIPVRVASVTAAADASISATGTLGAKDEIPLAFKIGGVVSSVSVDEGARVRKGQPLATLDLREIDAADFVLFRSLIIAHLRERGQMRWTGRVASIDAATLVASSNKQSARAADKSALRWTYEARMGDSEHIEIDSEGRILIRRDNWGNEAISLDPSSS